jgi:hypothetical protein
MYCTFVAVQSAQNVFVTDVAPERVAHYGDWTALWRFRFIQIPWTIKVERIEEHLNRETIVPMIKSSSIVRLIACSLMTSFMVSHGNGQTPSAFAKMWRLDKINSELPEGLRPYQTSFEQSLKIDVAGDVVTVVTTTVGIPSIGALGIFLPPEQLPFVAPPLPASLPESAEARAKPGEFVRSQTLEVDGQPRTFEWGDTIPQQTGSRTATWLPDMNGFEVVEYAGSSRTTHRWSISPDGEILTVESIQRGIVRENRLVRVFARQH